MEADVRRAERRGLVGGVAHVQEAFEAPQVLVRTAPGGEPCRLDVIGELNLEDVTQCGELDLAQQRARIDGAADVGAVTAPDVEDADVAERAHGLAYGRAADLHAGREIVLAGDAVSELPGSGRELPLQLVDHGVDG